MPRRKKQVRAKNGEGTFRTLPSGKREYRISYKDIYGQPARKSFSGWDEQECLDKCAEFMKELDRMMNGVDVNATIVEILENKYKEDFEMNFVGEAGYWRNIETLNMMRKRGIGNMPIKDVNKYHIMSYLKEITDYANGTISKSYLQLKQAFEIATDKEIIPKDLMRSRDIKCPKSNKPDKKVTGYTKEEQQMIEEALADHKIPSGRNTYKLQILIELYTGMRMGEINALRPEDIDLERKLVHVSRTVSVGMNNVHRIKEGAKTDAGTRAIPINKKAEAVLRQALDEKKDNPLGLLFYDYNKDAIIGTNQVNCFFRRICDKYGIPVKGQHALRHTFATRCIESGVQPVVLKKWMGHTDIHVTLDTYADVFDRMNDNAIELFDEYMDEI